MSPTTDSAEPPKGSVKEIPCPDCYGGHFKPCNVCGDSGIASLRVDSNAAGPASRLEAI